MLDFFAIGIAAYPMSMADYYEAQEKSKYTTISEQEFTVGGGEQEEIIDMDQQEDIIDMH